MGHGAGVFTHLKADPHKSLCLSQGTPCSKEQNGVLFGLPPLPPLSTAEAKKEPRLEEAGVRFPIT